MGQYMQEQHTLQNQQSSDDESENGVKAAKAIVSDDSDSSSDDDEEQVKIGDKLFKNKQSEADENSDPQQCMLLLQELKQT